MTDMYPKYVFDVLSAFVVFEDPVHLFVLIKVDKLHYCSVPAILFLLSQ
ncbi:hypothetical protein MXB_4293 [Myxobolus squamalis]|nr:hypothetical protein MXB_4293 [Myxobolus squamalis]